MTDFVAIIDLNLSNLHNVKLACDKLDINTKFASDPKMISKASAIILPGIGSFREAMQRIKKLKIEETIKEAIDKNKPLLGICLGMQLLFSHGEEFGKCKGLNIFNGKVKKLNFRNKKKIKYSVPHVGWNKIKYGKKNWKNTCLEGIENDEFMYFVHSFYVDTNNQSIIVAKTRYGEKIFCSAVSSKNIFACQFHPEKSGIGGLKIYKNFKNRF